MAVNSNSIYQNTRNGKRRRLQELEATPNNEETNYDEAEVVAAFTLMMLRHNYELNTVLSSRSPTDLISDEYLDPYTHSEKPSLTDHDYATYEGKNKRKRGSFADATKTTVISGAFSDSDTDKQSSQINRIAVQREFVEKSLNDETLSNYDSNAKLEHPLTDLSPINACRKILKDFMSKTQSYEIVE